jgi:hypothetical protein
MARQTARGKAGKKAIRKSYKAALTKLNIEAWRQLKRLAIDKDKPVSELQCEAINLLFASTACRRSPCVGRPRLAEPGRGGLSHRVGKL